jgi:hypothetical protein
MNCSWAALAGEAVVSYRGEIAGHAHLVTVYTYTVRQRSCTDLSNPVVDNLNQWFTHV